MNSAKRSKSALVFGISGEQGQYVAKGLLEAGYSLVYGATKDPSSISLSTLEFLRGSHSSAGAKSEFHLIQADLNDPLSIKRCLTKIKAASIFLVSKTDFLYPVDSPSSTVGSLKESEEREYESIKSFFDILVEINSCEDIDKSFNQHVIFSTLDDIHDIKNGEGAILDCQNNRHLSMITPLDDGSVLPQYAGKGRAGKYALQMLRTSSKISLTLLTLPLLHSAFLTAFVPLPTNEKKVQWTISACFGDSDTKIDMFSASDLRYIVPTVFENPILYDNYDIKLSAERISMDEIAFIFTDIFGKDVIYNPLKVDEMASLGFPISVYAQMCQFLSRPSSHHDLEATKALIFPRTPRLFKDWILANSDHNNFERVGLSLDAEREIECVAVFDARGLEGMSVIRGLLEDKRKNYKVRAIETDVEHKKPWDITGLDADKITFVTVDLNQVESCAKAVETADGVFLMTNFCATGCDPKVKERHVKNVIDACDASHTVRHLVFSTFEGVEEVNKELKPELLREDNGTISFFDIKAKVAMYVQTKKLSCTYILMPVYSEFFFEMIMPEIHVDTNTGEEQHIFPIPIEDEGETRVMCISVEELGPAVANIFDSYQVFSGHEIGLVTDFLTAREVQRKVQEVFFKGEGKESKVRTKEVGKVDWMKRRCTYMKDLGQIFQFYSKSNVVKTRQSIAKTMKLIPDARPLQKWLEENRHNTEFKTLLGLQ